MMPAAFHLQDVQRLEQSGRCRGRHKGPSKRPLKEAKAKAQGLTTPDTRRRKRGP